MIGFLLRRPPAMPVPTLDTSRWPLLIATFPRKVAEAELAEFYARWEVLCRGRGRHAILVDFRAYDPIFIPAEVRKFAAEEVLKRRDLFELVLVAEARVVLGAQRHLLTAFDWLAGRTFSRPLRNFGAYDEALSWLVGQPAFRTIVITG